MNYQFEINWIENKIRTINTLLGIPGSEEQREFLNQQLTQLKEELDNLQENQERETKRNKLFYY